jgi:para-nitrobenzyl esterase
MDLLADLSSDHTFLWPSFLLADAMAARGASVFAYRFDWAPPGSRFKACHCIELPFVFGTFDAWPEAGMLAGGNAAEMQTLSMAMRRRWIDLVRDGAPGPAWPRYDADRRATLLFDSVCDVAGDPAGLRWRA